MVELIATGGSGHRLHAGAAQVLPEAERDNRSRFALFLIFSPSNSHCWPFSSSQFTLLFWNICTNRKEAELLLTPTSLRSLQIDLLWNGERSLIYSFFPFEVPGYHFTNSKDNWTNFFSWRSSLNGVWICVQWHRQHRLISCQTRSVFHLVPCKVPDVQRCCFGLWWCSSNRLLVSPCRQMHSEKPDDIK